MNKFSLATIDILTSTYFSFIISTSWNNIQILCNIFSLGIKMNFSQYGKINSGSPTCNNLCSGRDLSHPYSISNLSTPTFSNRSYPPTFDTPSYPEQKRNFIECMEKGQPHIYGWNSCERFNPSSAPQSCMNDCCPPADCCDEYIMNNQCLMPEDSCSSSCMQW